MSSSDRLAEAVQHAHLGAYDLPRHPGYPVDGCSVCWSLLTYDADAPLREAEQAVIDAALSSPLYAGSDIWFAVRRLREVTGQ